MVLQLFIGLLLIALGSLLVTQGRRRRIWSVLILGGLCCVSYFLLDSLSHSADGGFIYQWLPYKTLKADFNISSSQRMQHMFLPLVYFLAALVYLNTIYAQEEHSLHFNTLVLFNFIALILQASSRDFIQLMFAGSMLSVISFYMPDLSSSKKKLFVFNFLAEMAVFTAFAVVYGKTRSVSLGTLPDFVRGGWHKDLVGGLLLFAIGCKCGLFLLNGQYFGLKHGLFNRVVAIMGLSVPLSGLILAAKIQPLLADSQITRSIMPWWAGISAGTAILAALLNNNIKSKAVSLSLAVYAALLYWIYTDTKVLYDWAPDILMLNFMALSVLVLAFGAASDETSVLRMGGFWRLTKINFALSILIVAACISCVSEWFIRGAEFTAALIYLGVVVIIMRMIYWGKSRASDMVASFARNSSLLYAVPLGIISAWLIWQNKSFVSVGSARLMLAAAGLFCLFPVRWLMRLGGLGVWRTDVLSFIYKNFFIMPLKLFGRILWLAFDVVVIERNVIGSVSGITSVIVKKMHRLQEIGLFNFMLGILLGILCMALYLGYYVYG